MHSSSSITKILRGMADVITSYSIHYTKLYDLGMGTQGEEFILLLDIDKIFTTEELGDVSSMAEAS